MFPWYLDTALVVLVLGAFGAIWASAESAVGIKAPSKKSDRR